jgi:NAD(P)-dependent dehydrogenase (short-subunit alcohol dehydrogenase family)
MEDPMPRLLEGKIAIVTGGGTGIGEAVCRKFAREGASVLVNGLPDDPIDDVVQDIVADGERATAFPGDISHDGTARKCVEAALSTFGKLDILINNAGVLVVNAATDAFPVDKFDEQIRCTSGQPS